MIRFGMHSSLWTSAWTREGAEKSVSECARHGLQVVEIALLDPDIIDVQHSLSLFERHGVAPTASLCLPQAAEASRHPEAARTFLIHALDVAHALGCNTLCGVTYSTLGYRSGAAPTEAEYDAIARALKHGWARNRCTSSSRWGKCASNPKHACKQSLRSQRKLCPHVDGLFAFH
jgi:D-psicose/D-tagatose/L-ribulose 3-epimerase